VGAETIWNQVGALYSTQSDNGSKIIVFLKDIYKYMELERADSIYQFTTSFLQTDLPRYNVNYWVFENIHKSTVVQLRKT